MPIAAPRCPHLIPCTSRPPALPALCLQACKRNPYLQSLVAQGHSVAYLARRAHESNRKIRLGHETLKYQFSAAEKRRRLAFAIEMLNQPPEFLKSIVWVDESSVPLVPAPRTYIGTAGDNYTRTDPRIPSDRRKIPYIHYILAVCYAEGLVQLDILSFTKGYANPVQYYVSKGLSFPASPSPGWAAILFSRA